MLSLQKQIKYVLGPTLLGVIDYYRYPEWRSGAPLNGQKHRQTMVEAFVRQLPLEIIVETGTFRGATTAYLATLAPLPVYTVECNKRFQGFSGMALRRFKNVSRFKDESRAFLKTLASRKDLYGKTILFYLDAHWGEELPLAEELEIIFSRWPQAVVLIDDFKVPDDAGYGYDNYGPGMALEIEYVRPAITKFGLSAFFPSVPATDETHPRQGSVTLVSDPALRKILRQISEIREYPAA